MKTRRRRGLLALSLALAAGGLAASEVHERERKVSEQLGPAVPVLVATRDLPAGARVSAAALAVRRVPVRFVPPDALASAAGLAGARPVVRVAAGGYVTAGVFQGSSTRHRGGRVVERGERAVTVGVSGAVGLGAGARVDVLVSTESGAGGGRTQMTLAGAELLRLDSGASGAAAPGVESGAGAPGAGGLTAPTALATLRVTLRQAVYLTAADNFAREIRLLARPAGDHAAAGAVVSQNQL